MPRPVRPALVAADVPTGACGTAIAPAATTYYAPSYPAATAPAVTGAGSAGLLRWRRDVCADQCHDVRPGDEPVLRVGPELDLHSGSPAEHQPPESAHRVFAELNNNSPTRPRRARRTRRVPQDIPGVDPANDDAAELYADADSRPNNSTGPAFEHGHSAQASESWRSDDLECR